jgi:hypothetical protein
VAVTLIAAARATLSSPAWGEILDYWGKNKDLALARLFSLYQPKSRASARVFYGLKCEPPYTLAMNGTRHGEGRGRIHARSTASSAVRIAAALPRMRAST